MSLDSNVFISKKPKRYSNYLIMCALVNLCWMENVVLESNYLYILSLNGNRLYYI